MFFTNLESELKLLVSKILISDPDLSVLDEKRKITFVRESYT